MSELIRAFADYLKDTLGISVKPEKWDGCHSLPVFMQSLYDCYIVQILSEKCLLLVSRSEDDATPATVQKHYQLVRKKWTGPVIVVRRSIRSDERYRLMVEYKLPFVVPGNQLYLPDIGLDIREHFRQVRKEPQRFSPSTQLLILHVLLTHSYAPLVSTELLSMLPYTPMTIKRALDEIEQAQIGTLRMRGRERELKFEKSGHELWNAALPFLRSPVQKQVKAIFPPNAVPSLEAGLTALSRYSMISAPTASTLAVSSEAWKTARNSLCVQEVDHEDENVHRLEIWRYDPALLSTGNTVDRLSLFLSLRESNDERVEAALDEMMENVQW